MRVARPSRNWNHDCGSCRRLFCTIPIFSVAAGKAEQVRMKSDRSAMGGVVHFYIRGCFRRDSRYAPLLNTPDPGIGHVDHSAEVEYGQDGRSRCRYLADRICKLHT